MKSKILLLILIAVLSISLFGCSDSSTVKPDDNTGKVTEPDKRSNIIFEQSLSELDANLDMQGNRLYWSPDGSYALFDAISSKSDAEPDAAVILADIKNNKLIKLKDGYLSNSVDWSKDSKLIAFTVNNELLLYNTKDKVLEKIADQGYMPRISPDNSKFIYMSEGLWIYDFASKSSSQITDGKYDSAPVWFSDSNRVFYFRDNGRNLGDGAGNQQVMSVLNIAEGNKFEDIDIDEKGKFRTARWLKQDEKLFIHAGWDDGNYYHILDIANNKLMKDIAAEDTYFTFDDKNKRILAWKGYTSSGIVTAYDYEMNKLGSCSIDNDKEYTAANENIGITALKGNRIIYLHTNQQENKGALMISHLDDGRQTRITDYGNYSMPFVSADGELLAYFENGNNLKVLLVNNLKETDVIKTESSSKAYNELLRMLPDRVGAEWQYIGFAEYGHTMRIDGINVMGEAKTQYTISGKVDDMSDGESKKNFDIYMEYIISKDGIREIIRKGEVMPHKIKEFYILRYPLAKGNTWTQQVEINGKKTELKAEILKEFVNEENNKVIKVQYTAKAEGMPNDTYTEIRTFEEGKGLVNFENTLDKDIEFNYSLYKFNK